MPIFLIVLGSLCVTHMSLFWVSQLNWLMQNKNMWCDKRCFFLLLLWSCLHSQALIKGLESAASTSGGKSLFNKHKETGRRKRTAEEGSDTNDTTFQSKWQKVATSSFKGTDLAWTKTQTPLAHTGWVKRMKLHCHKIPDRPQNSHFYNRK